MAEITDPTIDFPNGMDYKSAPAYDDKVLLFDPVTGKPVYTNIENISNMVKGQFMGNAVPATAPQAATPETQIWYLAGPGTYANFPGADSNPIVLTENLNVISWDGTKASVQAIPVSFDPSGYTQSGGYTGTAKDLDDIKASKVKADLSLIVLKGSAATTVGGVLLSAGWQRTAKMDVPTAPFRYTGSLSGTTVVGLAFYDDAGVFKGYLFKATSVAQVDFIDEPATPPAGATKMIVSGMTGAGTQPININVTEPVLTPLDLETIVSKQYLFDSVLSVNVFNPLAVLKGYMIATTSPFKIAINNANPTGITPFITIPIGTTHIAVSGNAANYNSSVSNYMINFYDTDNATATPVAHSAVGTALTAIFDLAALGVDTSTQKYLVMQAFYLSAGGVPDFSATQIEFSSEITPYKPFGIVDTLKPQFGGGGGGGTDYDQSLNTTDSVAFLSVNTGRLITEAIQANLPIWDGVDPAPDDLLVGDAYINSANNSLTVRMA